MRKAISAALTGAALVGMSATATVAFAQQASQGVPLPRPAPQVKTGTMPPPPAAAETKKSSNPVMSFAQSLPIPFFNNSKPTPNFDAGQRALVDKVNTYLTGVHMLAGDFVQVAPNGSKTEGKFYLQKPGRIRFEYNPPSPVELIADGTSVVVRDRKLATQDLYPLSQTPLRFLLADRIDLLKETDVTGVFSDELFVTVTIEEKHTFGGTHRLMMMFGARDMQLRQWTITDPQGYDTTVAVYNLENPKRLDPTLFKINYERMLQ